MARRLRIALGLAAALVTGAAPTRAADEPPPDGLRGTFLQLTRAHGTWTDEAWRSLFGDLRRLGALDVVVQWTVYDDTAFYPTARYVPVAHPPLEPILTLADELGMTVTVGLAHDPAFWSKVNRAPALVEPYLRTLQVRSEAVAGELVPLVTRHPSFRGWYITEEIEDGSWKDARARAALFESLRRLAGALRAMTPGAKIAISGFSNAETHPTTFGEFWTSLLRTAPIDVLMFQDGIGTKKQALSFLPLYLAAARDATTVNGRDLQVIVEIFQQTGDGGTFVPAPLPRIERQLKLARRYSGARGPIAFSIPEYMTPLGGAAAERLFEAYLTRIARPGVDR